MSSEGGPDDLSRAIRAAAGTVDATVTEAQQHASLYLLEDVLSASRPYGITLAHWEKGGVDLPQACVRVICTRSF
ncbi:hypothetical protein [Streptomyces sp. NPDC048516]|uniref:hypothetical protein n=1 Tax=Streptomyces sp. NPDC048516 TaxID=3365565 RepID=UPI00371DD67F